MRRSNPEISCLRPRSVIRQLPTSPREVPLGQLTVAKGTHDDRIGHRCLTPHESSARAGLLRELEWRNPA